MPTNAAAWLGAKQAKLEIKPAPYTPPRENEIVIRNHAVAINPIDWILQDVGSFIFPWIKYPFILGSDCAGEVAEVGLKVTRFKVGDRVLGHAIGTDKKRNRAAEGAFQEYTVLLAGMSSPIPTNLPYESAAVLPLGLSTAACGLFQKDHLALEYPSLTPKPNGKTVLIWGGSTSVGSNAIQLAVAAGYEVITTASPTNFEYVTRLGAAQVFDYHSKTVVQAVTQALEGKNFAGALAIGAGSAEPCADIVSAAKGVKFISTASTSVSFGSLPPRAGTGAILPVLLRIVGSTIAFTIKLKMRHIGTKAIFGTTLADNEVGSLIYNNYLPQALAAGSFVAAPEPQIIGKGLEQIQPGLELQKKGVSARKLVVSL